MTPARHSPGGAAMLAAYYFPGFHSDPRLDQWHGAGWTEWDVLRAARPRYPGHRQPRRPAWGYFDEADPVWAGKQAELALAYGIDAFIFDWYWYQNGDFLNGALDRGYLQTTGSRPQFAIMWANHDWLNIHPASAVHEPQILLPGRVSDYEFDCMGERLIERYFSNTDYLRVDGALYFSIYEPLTLSTGLGGHTAAAHAVERLRSRVRQAGLGEIHLNLVMADRGVLPGERVGSHVVSRLLTDLGASSATTYVWIHHYDPNTGGFPRGSYARALDVNQAAWSQMSKALPVTYLPNVTVGWDSSPRTVQSDRFEAADYPWLSVLDPEPREVEAAVRSALTFAEWSGSPMVTLNAWNEWTEGSYLLPDEFHGAALLEACLRAKTGRAADRLVT